MMKQKFTSRNVYVFFFSVLIFMLHFPVAFSSSKVSVFENSLAVKEATMVENSKSAISAMYENMGLKLKGLSEDAFEAAMTGFEKLTDQGKFLNQKLITI